MPAQSMAGITVRPIRQDERDELARIIKAVWGSTTIISRGVAHDAASLPCLLAVDGARWLGLGVYLPTDDECELVLLQAFERHSGIGTALLSATIEEARRQECRRLWLVTTNDNLDALRFYQRRGLRLARLWVNATTEARETLKPEIPIIGDYGITLRDELELELILTSGTDPATDQFEHRGYA